MYLCGPGKHNCQPFCGPEGRFDCSDSVSSLRPAPFFYLCVRVRILVSPLLFFHRLWTRESGGVIVRDTRHAIFLSRHYDRPQSSACWRPFWCQPATRARRPPHKFDILFIGVLFLWRRGCRDIIDRINRYPLFFCVVCFVTLFSIFSVLWLTPHWLPFIVLSLISKRNSHLSFPRLWPW